MQNHLDMLIARDTEGEKIAFVNGLLLFSLASSISETRPNNSDLME